MATDAMRRNLEASGFTVKANGLDWEIEPRVRWVVEAPDPPPPALQSFDAPGVSMVLRLTDQARPVTVSNQLATRFHLETLPSTPFGVSATPCETVHLSLEVHVESRADGKPLKGGPQSASVLRGGFEVPAELHSMGTATGTLVPVGVDSIAFLHMAEVDGERRYVAASLQLSTNLVTDSS